MKIKFVLNVKHSAQYLVYGSKLKGKHYYASIIHSTLVLFSFMSCPLQSLLLGLCVSSTPSLNPSSYIILELKTLSGFPCL